MQTFKNQNEAELIEVKFDSSEINHKKDDLKGWREKAVSRALEELGIDYRYEPKEYQFQLHKLGINSKYKPDFVLDTYYKEKGFDKQVIIETHTKFDWYYIKRMKEFSKEYNNFKLIFVMPLLTNKGLSKQQLNYLNRFSIVLTINETNEKSKNKNRVKNNYQNDNKIKHMANKLKDSLTKLPLNDYYHNPIKNSKELLRKY